MCNKRWPFDDRVILPEGIEKYGHTSFADDQKARNSQASFRCALYWEEPKRSHLIHRIAAFSNFRSFSACDWKLLGIQ
jgi:hypothetical protein